MHEKNTTSISKGSTFELEVTQAYRDLGCRVEHNRNVSGLQIDIFVIQEAPDGSLIRTAVECKAYKSPLGLNDAVDIATRTQSLLNQRAVDKVVVLTLNGYTQDARTHLSASQIECFVLADLKRRIADFTQHLTDLRNDYRLMEVSERNLFVDLSARTERDELITSVTEHIDVWINGPGQLLTVLGEYGSGKTTLSWHVADDYAERCQEGFGTNRIPILIELRHFGQHFNLRGFLTDYLLNEKHTNIRSYATFERLNAEGRFLLILDAFDEMTITSDVTVFKRHFLDILELARHKAKVIITCRTSFFRDNTDLDRYSLTTDLYDLMHQHHTYSLLFLNSFAEEQVQEYIFKFYGAKWLNVYLGIEERDDLRSLVTRPILLNMLVRSVEDASTIRHMDVTRLYDVVTNAWLLRDDWRCKLPIESRGEVSRYLAFVMVRNKLSSMHHEELRTRLKEALIPLALSESDLEQYAHEVRTCTFLRTDLHGSYSFVHRSFAEFLAAKHMINCLGRGLRNVLAEPVSPETLVFFAGLVRAEGDRYRAFLWDCLAPSGEEGGDAAASRTRATATFVLHQAGHSVEGIVLRDAVFPSGISLNGVSFQGTDLSGATLCGVSLVDANLSGARLVNAHLRDASLVGTDLSKASLQGCDLSRSDLLGSNMDGADLHGAIMQDTLLVPQDGIRDVRTRYGDRLRGIRTRLVTTVRLWKRFRKCAKLQKFAARIEAVDFEELVKQEHAFLVREADISKKDIGEWEETWAEEIDERMKRIEGRIQAIEARKMDLAEMRREIRLENLKKRECRREMREVRIRCGILYSRLDAVIEVLKELSKELASVEAASGQRSTSVSHARFSSAVGLSVSQVLWLLQHGAFVSTENT
ncbi:MAG: pentapeptide repeat-containing protein [Candidatus Hydrogenedentes bacterium]|nr:pentapeptide repeat-containing protein [Candidatus Hydrogenedentota bacterium]